MNFKSVAEILRFALSKEKASLQFYIDVASRVTNVATKCMFEAIEKEEQKHIEAIELELMKLGVTVYPEKDMRESDFEWSESLEIDQGDENMDYRDAIYVAIQKEKAAFQLYTQVLGMVQEPEYRKIFMELAQEEMRHLMQFEREYQALSE